MKFQLWSACLVGLAMSSAGLPGAEENAAAVAPGEAAPEEAPKPADRHPRPLQVMSPEHPLELLKAGVDGEAILVCSIGEQGEVLDAKIESATHIGFGESARAALLKWKFEPGLRGGRPARYEMEIPFVFKILPEDRLEAAVGRKVFAAIEEPIIPAERLKEWPAPRKVFWPRYPEKLKGTGIEGRAVVAFVIDKEGRTVNPKLIKVTHPEFIAPAVATVLKLAYNPVIFKNHPVYVGMRVQYDFSEAHSREPGKTRGAPAQGQQAPERTP